MNTENKIDNYFDRVKQNPPLMDIEKVRQVITEVEAKVETEAEAKVEVEVEVKKGHRNLLKFTIMTTIFAVIVSAVLFWPNKNVEHPVQVKNELQTEKSASASTQEETVQQNDLKDNSVELNRLQKNAELLSNNKNSIKNESFINDDENSDYSPKKSNKFKSSNYALYENLENVSCDFEMILYDKKELDINDKDNTIWLSINSNQTKALVSGEYHFSASNKNIREPMSFSGQYYFKSDSTIKITDGKMSVDTSKANQSIVYEFIMENNLKISGKYFPQPDEKEILNPTIENPKKEYAYPDQILDSTMFIELNRKELENLGFNFAEEYIKLQFLKTMFTLYTDEGLIFGVEFDDDTLSQNLLPSKLNFKAESLSVTMNKRSHDNTNEGIVPMLVTNKNGKELLKVSLPETDLAKMFSPQYPKDFRTLLPVIIKKNTFGYQPKEDLVYWFLPSDTFLNQLPKGISNKLLGEYNYIIAEDKSTLVKPECKYFDECKNTLKVSNFKVYPNPASNQITVNFTLPESIEGRISLVDLSGREKQVLLPNTTYSKGSHQFDLDLSTVSEGIYLIALYSNKGIQTQRLIVVR